MSKPVKQTRAKRGRTAAGREGADGEPSAPRTTGQQRGEASTGNGLPPAPNMSTVGPGQPPASDPCFLRGERAETP